ncbi:hypothetical protein ACOSQ2_029374 [Xanthoceras sorbifolium]
MGLNKNLVGLGIICRDHSGSVLAASAQKLIAGYSVFIAEALAVLRGLQFALASGLLPVVLETDSLDVAFVINNPSSYFSKVELHTVDSYVEPAAISDVLSDLVNCIY